MRTALAVLSLASAARALSAYHSQRTHSLEAANYRAQASQLRKEAAILETELIKERKALEALRELENPKPAETTPQKPVLVAKAGAVEVRWALDDAGALKAKVPPAADARLDDRGARPTGRSCSRRRPPRRARRLRAPMMAAECPRCRRGGKRASDARRRAGRRVVKALALLRRRAGGSPPLVRHRSATAAGRGAVLRI